MADPPAGSPRLPAQGRRSRRVATRFEGETLELLFLVVAIAVIVALTFGALYAVTSGLTGGSAGCCLYALQMSNLGSSHTTATVFGVELGIDPTTGLTTGFFGMKMSNASYVFIPPGVPPASCAAPNRTSAIAFTPESCGAPESGWYVVLVFENNTIASVLGSSEHWLGAPVALDGRMHIDLVSGTAYAATGEFLSAYGTGVSSVSGSVAL
jgi:hypothetical protein